MTISPEAARAELARRELARRHLLPYVQRTCPDYSTGWWHEEVCERLEAFVAAIKAKRGPRLLLFAPPRHGKSQIISRSLPCWYLGQCPDKEVVVTTYGQELASDLGRWAKRSLTEPAHAIFPGLHLREDSRAADRLDTDAGGGIRYVGVGGSLTGRGADLLIIDDPVRNREDADSPLIRERTWDWYVSVARTRLAPGGGIVVLQTRWHLDDLSGRLVNAQATGGEAWELVSYPAIATEDEAHRKRGEPLHLSRWPLAELGKLRQALPARDWSALYQQSPVSDTGGYFQLPWFRSYTQTPPTGEVAIAADFAYRQGQDNDYTAVLPFGLSEASELVFLPGAFCERLATDQTVERILDLAETTGASTLVSGRDSIQSIGPFLRTRMAERRIWLTVVERPESKVTGDLQARARSLQARMQQGKVLWPAGELLEGIIKPQHLNFPAGKHDDSVSAAAMACWLLDTQSNYTPPRNPEWKNPDEERWKKRGHKPPAPAPSLFGRTR